MSRGRQDQALRWTQLFLRISLAASFISAVADRFGLWGAPGSAGVVWGDFAEFEKYTALVNSFLPFSWIPSLAWIATILELVIALLLLTGYKLKLAAFSSGLLLSLFFIAMTISVGIKAPLDYSVLSAAAASFLLARTAILPR